MFASLKRKEIAIRAVLVAAILFNALASNPVLAQSESAVERKSLDYVTNLNSENRSLPPRPRHPESAPIAQAHTPVIECDLLGTNVCEQISDTLIKLSMVMDKAGHASGWFYVNQEANLYYLGEYSVVANVWEVWGSNVNILVSLPGYGNYLSDSYYIPKNGSATISGTISVVTPTTVTPQHTFTSQIFQGSPDAGISTIPGSSWDIYVSTEPIPHAVHIPEPYLVGGGVGDACLGATYSSATGFFAGPINTRTGGYDYTVVDLSLPTSAGELSFQREYTSFSIDNPTVLSPGWTHNHDIRLVFPTDPEGEPDIVLFKAHTANKYIFNINGDGTYSPYPGLCSTLVYDQGSYILKDAGQKTYTFDSSGKLLSYADSQAHPWYYSYLTDGKLDRISADGGSKYLDLDYDLQGRIESVRDHSGRSVTYHYDVSTGDLTSVDDVLDQSWTYEYDQNLDNILARVAAPGNVTVERTEYYPDGRAWKQFDGEDNLIVELIYNSDGTTTIKDSVDDANPKIHTYDGRGTLITEDNSEGGQQNKDYDLNFRPYLITDPMGNQTKLTWSNTGTNLEYIKDALGNETFISYGNFNNPTSIIDPAGYETKYFYTDSNFPTLPTRIEYPLSFDGGTTHIGTDYEYYPPSSGASAGKVKIVTDALGNQTFYTYDSSGQTETVTTAYGTPEALTTTYAYNQFGWLEDVTDEQGLVTHNEYDDAGRLITTVYNVHPTISTQNYQDKYNVTTKYFYDARSNQIAVIDTYDTITRTYFDLANRPVTVVQNLFITGTENDITTPIGSVPAYDPGYPDRNVRRDTEYDDAGNAIVAHDPAGIITRTYYDAANRPKLVVQNWSGSDLYDNDYHNAPSYVASYPDQNVRTEYFYDLNGNVIATMDTLGVIARTYYDELNRPKIVVQNLFINGTPDDIDQPLSAVPLYSSTYPDRNLRTVTYYDANGNVILTVDPKGTLSRTYYDAMNRPITVVQNLDRTIVDAINNPNPPDAGNSDVNIRTDTYYDEVGNVEYTVDPRGVVTQTDYDEANRPVLATQNPGGSTGETLQTSIDYDQYGRKDTTTDTLGRVTKYEYDEVGQLVRVTANHVNGGSPQNEDDQRNIVTEYFYDALGRQIQTTDTLDRINVTSYDDLGRVLSVTRNYLEGQPQNYEVDGNRFNIKTTYSYDERSSQVAVMDTKGIVTRTYYDALNRSIAVVRNLTGLISDPIPPARANPPSSTANLRTDTVYLGDGNMDVIDELGKTTHYEYNGLKRLITVSDPLSHPTVYSYDANGNRTLMTDAEGVSTRYEYDNLNRLKAVVENYVVPANPDTETNVRTEYTYDANGNRLSIRDGQSFLEGVDYRTAFTYDNLGRVKTETDPLGNGTLYTYSQDTIGNIVSIRDAMFATTVYHYDELDRLFEIDYPSPDPDVTFTYDALGRRLSMTDGLGETTWDYNNLDQPNYIDDPFSARVFYEYDEAGNRDKLTYPDGRVVNYVYNDVNRLESVATTGVGTTGYEYDAAGRLKTVTRPNSVNTTYNYYDNGWLQDIFHILGTETLASYQYQYYPDGNRSQVIENVLNPQQQASIGSGFALNSHAAQAHLTSFDARSKTADPSSKGLYSIAPQQVEFGRPPLNFIANIGQFNKEVAFQTNSLGGSIFFTPSEIVLALMDKKIKSKVKEDGIDSPAVDNSKVVRIEYKGADKKAVIEGVELLPGVANFVIGMDEQAWISNAPMYSGIVYRQLYPGIDINYEGAGNNLKSTFIIEVGADPSLIQWRYKDAGDVTMNEGGNILITLPAKKAEQSDTTLIEHAPIAWQDLEGQRVNVPVEYVLTPNDEISFVLPDGYDTSVPLYIDPVLTYSTYLGDIGTDVGTAITTDPSGNVYVTGFSWCGDFPTVDPITGVTGTEGEVIISKLSADGSTLLYSTCVGGSGDDFGASIALDTQGRVVVAGETDSTDFPIVAGVGTYGGGSCSSEAPCQDTFILALNSDGSAIRYSTYLGGNGREEVGGIRVDSNGKIIVVGSTTSMNFPAVNAYDSTFAGGTCPNYWPCYDATVTKIDPELSGSNSILYSTYLGGVDHDKAYGVVLDENNIVYLAGYSDSDGYPVRNALQSSVGGDVDVTVSQIDPSLTGDASLLYSTYLGGPDTENGYAIARDGSGNLFITGRTSSSRLPLRDPLQFESHAGSTCNGSTCYEAFVTKLDINANKVVYSTYLGGSHNDEGFGIAVDSHGRAYVTGFTRSSDYPTFDAIQSTKGVDGCSSTPCRDAFLSVLEPDGQSFAYSTFLGGDQDDTVNGITIDSSNNVYLIGETYSTNFPTTPGAYDVINTETNKRDAFIAKIGALGTPPSQLFLHLDVPIATGNDDAEETNSSGNVSLNSNDIELGRDSSEQTVGMRFAGMDIPQGVVIQDAWIQFRVDEATSEATSLTIRAEAGDDAPAFITTPLNISTRPKTALSVHWSPAAWDTVDEAGPDQRTPNLASLVQEIVNRPGWAEGNAINFIITGSGKRVADSFEEDMHGAAYLHIEYVETTDPPAPSSGTILTFQPDGASGMDTYLLSSSANTNYGTSGDMGVGENNNSTNKYARSLIKFDLSSIPADATIVSATLSLWTSIDNSSNDSTVRVYRLKVPFHETQATWNKSSSSTNWQTPGAAGANDRESVDIGSVQILASEPLNTEKQIQLSPEKVQELIDGGFANNGFILVTDAELNDRFDYKTSDTSTAGRRPKLVVEYTTQVPGQLGLEITPNPTLFTGAGENIFYTYTLTNIGTMPLNGPYAVSDDKVASVDCSAAQSPLAVSQSTTCIGIYTTTAGDVTAGSVTDSAVASASDGTQTVTSDIVTATVTYQAPPPPPTGPITIDYVYDSLNRLTEANYIETGDYYHYTYDAVGNRLTQDTLVGGLPSVTMYIYKDNNVIDMVNGIHYVFDANGNLKNDGVNTYTYDSANRLKTFANTTTTAMYSYNGLNDRLQETVNGITTTFTMDLNTGLTQALSDGTNSYIYGVGRIAQVNTGTEYFLGDALGSVRQLTDQSGEITYARAYDPYGAVTSTTGTSQSAYAFTGEYWGDSTQLTYLRSRFYAGNTGRFLTRDMWMGDHDNPLSLNRWNYTNANPVNFIDPSGKAPSDSGDYPRHCQSMPTKAEYAACVLRFFKLEPLDPNDIGKFITGDQGCYAGPTQYRAPGYIEGFNAGHNTPFALSKTWFGWEVVYDFATLQRQSFTYNSFWGHGEDTSLGISASQYIGTVKGFRTSVGAEDQIYDINDDYRGISENWNLGVSLYIGAGGGYFESQADPLIRGSVVYVGLSDGVSEFIANMDFGYRLNNYTPWGYQGQQFPPRNYDLGNGVIDLGAMMSDIRSGYNSPLEEYGGVGVYYTQAYRVYQAGLAAKYVFAYQALRYQQVIGW